MTTTDNNIIKFQPGLKYSARSVCDYNCIWTFTVVKRTAKFITIEDKFGEVTRVGVSEWDGAETAYPFGKYSMCPSIRADEAGIKRAEWEVAA